METGDSLFASTELKKIPPEPELSAGSAYTGQPVTPLRPRAQPGGVPKHRSGFSSSLLIRDPQDDRNSQMGFLGSQAVSEERSDTKWEFFLFIYFLLLLS